MAKAQDEDTIDTDLLLDRLVSASNSEDVEAALHQIVEALPIVIAVEDTVWSALISIFHEGEFRGLQVPDGRTTAGRILLEQLKSGSTTADTLLQTPGRLLESCIDVACNREMAIYPRILALQILQTLSSNNSREAQSQWLAAPNGLHRIADLLRDDTELQTETLSLATTLAQWSAVAKVWMFAEMGDVVLQTALQAGGLTAGSVTVLECLQLLRALVSHDAALADLVVAESPMVVPGLCQLLDLRAAQAFRFPATLAGKADTEDLDALLSNASGDASIPYLLEAEEKIIYCVFDILETVLENESLKESVWQKHKALGTFVWDMALLIPPPPGQKAFCGVPSVELRVAAFRTAAQYFHYSDAQPRGGWDRLLGAICTSEDPRLSHGALHLLRRSCTEAAANDILMQGLAPAIMDGGDEAQQQQQANVVRKLLNTILEQLNSEERRPVLIVGALFALSVFLTDEARRSILFKISQTDGQESTLLSAIFAYLERESENPTTVDPYVTWHVWHFLAVWMQQAPVVVQAVLTSPHQPLLVNNTKHPMARLCLGMAVLYGGDEGLCGGWSRSSLLQAAQPWSRWTTALEGLKNKENFSPYIHSVEEGTVWKDWVTPAVLEIRQAMVEEMTSAAAESSDEDGLGRVLKEQAAELEQLRSSLQDAQRRIEAQDNELDTWRKRVESNPTQLDQLLNDSTSKISTLEQTIAALRSEKEEQATLHEQVLQERDQQLADVQKDLAISRDEEVDAKAERDTIREEMAALSQAYTSLEEDYRAQQQERAVDTSPDHQQEGEESGQSAAASSSTEVVSLRAEVNRLRGDVKSAEDWMNMAYERMNEMSTQNDSLQRRLNAQEPSDPSSSDAQPVDTIMEMNSLREEISNLRIELEEQRQEASKAVEERDELISGSEKSTSSEEELQRLRSDNEAAQQWMSQAVEHHQMITQELEALKQQNQLLSEKLEAPLNGTTTVDHSHEDEVLRLREEIEAYQAHKESMAGMDQNLQATQSQLEALRAELVVKDQELRLLTSNNLPRSDTSSDEMLQSEIANLRRELQQNNEELTQKCSDVSGLESLVAELRQESEIRATETETLKFASEGEQAESQNRILGLEEDKRQLETQLEQQRKEAQSIIAQWQGSYEALKSRADEMEAKMTNNTDSQMQRGENDSDRVRDLKDQVRNLQDQLSDQERDANEALSQWQETYDSVEEKLRSVSEQQTTLMSDYEVSQRQVIQMGVENADLVEQSTDLHSKIAELNSQAIEKESELNTLRDTLATQNIELEELKMSQPLDRSTNTTEAGEKSADVLQATIQNLQEQLEDQTEESKQETIQWEESYAAQTEELEVCKHNLEDAMRELEEARVEFKTELARFEHSSSQLEDDLANRDGELKELREKLAALESSGRESNGSHPDESLNDKLLALEHQRSTGQAEIARWQKSYEEVSSQLDSANERLANSVTSETLQERISNLEEQLRSEQAAANEVVVEWERSYQEVATQLDTANDKLALLAAAEKETNADITHGSAHTRSTESLTDEIVRLEDQLKAQEESANDIVSQWEASYHDVSAQLDAAHAKLFELANEEVGNDRRTLSNSHDIELTKLNEEVSRLSQELALSKQAEVEPSKVSSLEEQLVAERESTETLLQQWESGYNDIASQLQEANDRLHAQSRDETGDTGVSDIIRELRLKLENREKELDIARQTLSNFERESWQQTAGDREIELKDTVEKLELKLSGEQTTAENLLLRWEESYNGVVAQLDDVTEKLQQSYQAAQIAAEDSKLLTEEVENLRRQLLEREQELITSRSENSSSESQISLLQEKVATLNTELESDSQIVADWEKSYCALKADYDQVSSELQTLRNDDENRSKARQLPLAISEEEVLEMKDELQARESGLAQARESVIRYEKQNAELVEQVGNLQARIVDEKFESDDLLSQWESSYNGVAKQLEEANEKLASVTASCVTQTNNEVPASDEDQPTEPEVAQRVSELEEHVAMLEARIADDDARTTSVLSGWQSNYDAVSEELQQCKAFNLQWEESYASLQREHDEAVAEMLNRRDLSLDEPTQVVRSVGVDPETDKTMNAEITELKKQLLDRQNSYQDQLEDWENVKQDQEQKLAVAYAQIEETQVAAARWEDKCKELELQLSQARESVETTQSKPSVIDATIQSSSSAHHQQISDALSGQVDELNNQILEERSITAQWVESHNDLAQQLEEANERIIELSSATFAPESAETEPGETSDSNSGRATGDARIQLLEAELEDAKCILVQWEESYNAQGRELEQTMESLVRTELEVQALKNIAAENTELAASVAQLEEDLLRAEKESSEKQAQSEQQLHSKNAELVSSHAVLQALGNEILTMTTGGSSPATSENPEEFLGDPNSFVSALSVWSKTQTDLVSEWESCYNDIESQLREANKVNKSLQSDVCVLQAALQVYENQPDEDAASDAGQSNFSKKEEELTKLINSLEAQIEEDQKQYSEIVDQWQTGYSELEEQFGATQEELTRLRREVDMSRSVESKDKTEVVQQFESISQTEESKSQISRLEAELEKTELLVKNWEDEYKVFQKEAQEVISKWRNQNESLGQQLEQSLEQTELNRGHIEDLQSQLELAQKQMEMDMANHAKEDEAQTKKLQELKADLEASSRERLLAQNEALELREAIKSREKQVEELKERLDQLSRRSSELQTVESDVADSREKIKSLEREVELEKNEKRLAEDKLMQMGEQFKTQLEASRSEHAVSKQTVEAELTVHREKLDIADETLRSLRQEKACSQQEIADLKARNEELVDEIQEATAALQISASERASERASDVAASILKRQIQELHAQLDDDQRAFASERKAREASEAETTRLQANLTALLGLENTEQNRGLIEQRLVEATESFQRTERAEILMLKKSLERALGDLEAARISEKQKEEQAAKATYQANLFEQQLVATKSDFNFVAESADEIRQYEESKRASLEYRLSSLVNEQSVQRKCHAAEVENLRNELGQIKMERDRLFQAVKESEKSREALVQASSRERRSGNELDAQAEVDRLRVEKAQLLAAASDEAARTERKIRETRAATMAASEADIILEKELRYSAEKSLASAKVELDQFRAQTDMQLSTGSVEEELRVLRIELESTKRSRTALEEEVKALTDNLAEVKKTNNSSIERLTEDCRKAIARASLLERDGRVQAEIIAEVSRLRHKKDTATTSEEDALVLHDDEGKERSDELLELMNQVQMQKEECEKERSMYFNVLKEHDDLLALVAQQDILTSSLKEALSQESGQGSLEKAVRVAEDEVKSKYGKFVRL